MHNINCTNCGFANPLKTEYLTFCERCGKKLPVNFPEWSRLHPSGNFEEFKREVGTKAVPADPSSKMRKFPLKIIYITVIVALLAGLSYRFFEGGGDLQGLFLPANTPGSVLTGNWERRTYGSFGLSLQAPEQLKKTELNIPASFRQRLKDAESFYYRPSKGFRVMISSLLFEEGVGVNLEGAATGAVNELINQPGVANLEFKISPLMFDNVRGVLLDGFFHENGIFTRFQCAVYAQRSNMWSVWVIYRDADQNGMKAAQRIMDSVEINSDLKTI